MPEGTSVKLPHCLKPTEQFTLDQVIVWFLISLMRFSTVYELVWLVLLVFLEYRVCGSQMHTSFIYRRQIRSVVIFVSQMNVLRI